MSAGQTPPRSVRVPTPVWDAARRTAASRGETVTDAVVRFLTIYGQGELEDEQAAAGRDSRPTPRPIPGAPSL